MTVTELAICVDRGHNRGRADHDGLILAGRARLAGASQAPVARRVRRGAIAAAALAGRRRARLARYPPARRLRRAAAGSAKRIAAPARRRCPATRSARGWWRPARNGGAASWQGRRKTWLRPRYDVSGTSQRTKSHHWAVSSSGEANACTPRPTSSRVTTADGRSPGLRVVYLASPSQDRDSQWRMTKDSPLTVAGAAAELGNFPAPHSLLIPEAGTVRNYGRSLTRTKSIPSGDAGIPRWTSASFLSHEQGWTELM